MDANSLGESVVKSFYHQITRCSDEVPTSSNVTQNDSMSLAVDEHTEPVNRKDSRDLKNALEDGEKRIPTADDLVKFSDYFKKRRMALGYSQSDVGSAVGSKFHREFSQTTICRFEALQLSFKNMCNLKAILEKWLEEVEQGKAKSFEELQRFRSLGKRKRRASIELKVKLALEKQFLKNSRPTRDEILTIANAMGLDKDVVRVWFCNRRQKEKRVKEQNVEDCCVTDSKLSNDGNISQLINGNLEKSGNTSTLPA